MYLYPGFNWYDLGYYFLHEEEPLSRNRNLVLPCVNYTSILSYFFSEWKWLQSDFSWLLCEK